jgi:dihydrolipoamide dehydrogenase
VKLITDNDKHIIGCHVLGAHAADIVQEAAVLIAKDATIDDLADIVHIHPTLSEVLHDASLV